ncbi:MAG: hypothetical protein IEMM0008_1716 [bacterium]|nr:MAG: hypothetical protein IEMM0008_1716 [bacterium]
MPVEIHMKEGKKLADLNDLLYEQFGFKGVYLFEQFCNQAAVRDYCDIITKDKVYLNALISKSVLVSVNSVNRGGLEGFYEATSDVAIVYDGDKETAIHFKDVLALYPMPGGDPSEEDLLNVDMDEADDVIGEGDRTIREMIADHYKCKDESETDKFVRRFLA